MPAADPHELWFITGSQQLYGEEEIHTVAAMARQVAAVLGDTEGMPTKVVPDPVVTTAEARYTAFTTNVGMHALETWAGIVDIAFLGIEAETTLRSFRRHMHESC